MSSLDGDILVCLREWKRDLSFDFDCFLIFPLFVFHFPPLILPPSLLDPLYLGNMMVDELGMMGISDTKDQQTIFTALGLNRKEGEEGEEEGEKEGREKEDDEKEDGEKEDEEDKGRAVKFAVGGIEVDLIDGNEEREKEERDKEREREREREREKEKEKEEEKKRRGSFISSFRATLTPQRGDRAPRNRLAGEVSDYLCTL